MIRQKSKPQLWARDYSFGSFFTCHHSCVPFFSNRCVNVVLDENTGSSYTPLFPQKGISQPTDTSNINELTNNDMSCLGHFWWPVWWPMKMGPMVQTNGTPRTLGNQQTSKRGLKQWLFQGYIKVQVVNHSQLKPSQEDPTTPTTTTAPLALFLKSNDYQGYGGSHLSTMGLA